MAEPPALYEDSVVWLEDIEPLDYVRTIGDYRGSRRGRPRTNWLEGQGRLVGYTTVDHNNTGMPHSFHRRVFWLTNHDRDSDPDGVYEMGEPNEAVDPRTIAPGESGRSTIRSWFGTGDRAEAFMRRSVEEGWATTPSDLGDQ